MAFFNYMSLEFEAELAARGAKLVERILKKDINSSLHHRENPNKIVN